VRKGAIVNIQDTVSAIDAAIEAAERMAGYEVNAVTVNVNGAHIVGMNSKGVVAISSSTREISLDDLARVEEAATVVQLPANRERLMLMWLRPLRQVCAIWKSQWNQPAQLCTIDCLEVWPQPKP
jgi:cell division protein FtsA